MTSGMLMASSCVRGVEVRIAIPPELIVALTVDEQQFADLFTKVVEMQTKYLVIAATSKDLSLRALHILLANIAKSFMELLAESVGEGEAESTVEEKQGSSIPERLYIFEAFGRGAEAVRLELDISLRVLAEVAEVRPEELQTLLNPGLLCNIGRPEARRIAEALGYSVLELIGRGGCEAFQCPICEFYVRKGAACAFCAET